VILDSGDEVEAKFYSNGSIVINTEDPAIISKDEETVVTLTGEIDPGRNITGDANRSIKIVAVGRSTVYIDSVLGIVRIHLAPTSRYISYSNTTAKPFAIYCPPDVEYDFYLKKHIDQIVDFGNCTQCGMIDYTKSIM